MKYFLGIDGGGTKTAFLLVSQQGTVVGEMTAVGCSYRQYGIDTVIERLQQQVMECIVKAGISKRELAGVCIGLPCYGESKRMDEAVRERFAEIFCEIPYYLANDVQVGWAGSLGLAPGINVVAGTGSIAYGEDETGNQARSGGWSDFYGDEGSCHWLGRLTMELFSKQADGRCEKGPLYDLVMSDLKLEEPLDFIDRMEEEYIGKRDRIASLQKLLLKAAAAGDSQVCNAYQKAAEELGLLVKGCKKQLDFKNYPIMVSLSGGLTYAQEFVLPRFEKLVQEEGGHVRTPLFTPVQGAVLLAVQQFGVEYLNDIKEQLTSEKETEGI